MGVARAGGEVARAEGRGSEVRGGGDTWRHGGAARRSSKFSYRALCATGAVEREIRTFPSLPRIFPRNFLRFPERSPGRAKIAAMVRTRYGDFKNLPPPSIPIVKEGLSSLAL